VVVFLFVILFFSNIVFGLNNSNQLALAACPPGTFLNPDTLQCETDSTCPDGTEFNPDTDECGILPDCPDNSRFDPSIRKCVSFDPPRLVCPQDVEPVNGICIVESERGEPCADGLTLTEDKECRGPPQPTCLDALDVLDPKGTDCIKEILCPPSFRANPNEISCSALLSESECDSKGGSLVDNVKCVIALLDCPGGLPPAPQLDNNGEPTGKFECLSVPIYACPLGTIVDPDTIDFNVDFQNPITLECVGPGDRNCPANTDYSKLLCLADSLYVCPKDFEPTEDILPLCVADPVCPAGHDIVMALRPGDTLGRSDGYCAPPRDAACPNGIYQEFLGTCTGIADLNCSDTAVAKPTQIPNSPNVPSGQLSNEGTAHLPVKGSITTGLPSISPGQLTSVVICVHLPVVKGLYCESSEHARPAQKPFASTRPSSHGESRVQPPKESCELPSGHTIVAGPSQNALSSTSPKSKGSNVGT